jgi:ribosomal protein L22
MEVHAIMKNVRMSAQKMREVVRQIQGLPAAHAQAVLAVVPRKGARFVAKTLASAIANAEDLKEHKKEYGAMTPKQRPRCGGSRPRRGAQPGQS